MNIVTWARVSSREQADGYSLDAQTRAMQAKARQEDWIIIREFTAAESAKRGAERKKFQDMIAYVKGNAKRERIGGILFHKLDRAARNLPDFVIIRDLEKSHGVKSLFVEDYFGPGAASHLTQNLLASIAQFYSDNLRTEVLKGMNEKSEQGWYPAHAPYGYCNDSTDRSNQSSQTQKLVAS